MKSSSYPGHPAFLEAAAKRLGLQAERGTVVRVTNTPVLRSMSVLVGQMNAVAPDARPGICTEVGKLAQEAELIAETARLVHADACKRAGIEPPSPTTEQQQAEAKAQSTKPKKGKS